MTTKLLSHSPSAGKQLSTTQLLAHSFPGGWVRESGQDRGRKQDGEARGLRQT